MINIFKKDNAFIITLIVSILFLIVFYVLSYFQLIQSEESLSFIGEASRWCERISAGAFREPINTLTNLGFMVAGLYILYTLTNETSFNDFSGLNKITILYGVAVVYLGPGSMMMHGTNTEWGGWADNLSMVMYIIIPWLYNIYKMSEWSVNTFLKVYISIVVFYAVMRGLFGKVLLSDEDCDSIKELYKDKLVRIEDRNAFPARAHHKYNETDPDSWLHKTVQSLITSNLGDDYYLIQRVTVLRYRINDIFGDHYDGSWNVQSNKLLTENHFYGGVELSNREDFKGGEHKWCIRGALALGFVLGALVC